jgi:hypothetical protein
MDGLFVLKKNTANILELGWNLKSYMSAIDSSALVIRSTKDGLDIAGIYYVQHSMRILTIYLEYSQPAYNVKKTLLQRSVSAGFFLLHSLLLMT